MHPLHTLLNNQPVQWKTLGEVLTRTKGTKITAQQMRELHKDNAPVTVYGGGKTIAQLNYDDLPAKDVQNKPSIIVKSRGIIEFEYCQRPFSHKNELWAYHAPNDQVNSKFVYYFLKQHEPYFRQIASKMQMPQIATPDTDNFKIPLPPLPLQARIVEILDKFTACNEQLTTALNKEHTLRKKQYAYYRDLLLSEAELSKVGFEWKALGEIASDFGRGKSKHRPRNDERLYGGNVPFIQTGDIRNASKYIQQYSQTYSELGLQQSKLWKKDTLCITIAANIAETAILDFDACFPDSVIGFVPDPKQANVSYVYYVLQSLKEKLQSFSTGGAQENINLGTFEQIKFPIPPLAHQRKIVDILDRFDTLTNSITQGIPREIELRRKQYEYYRELLLTFE